MTTHVDDHTNRSAPRSSRGKLGRSDLEVSAIGFVPRFAPEARKANQALVDQLASIAKAKDVTSAQIALVWLLAQKPWIVPIPGTTKLRRLKENTGAADVTLTGDDVRKIRDALASLQVIGDRCPAHLASRAGK